MASNEINGDDLSHLMKQADDLARDYEAHDDARASPRDNVDDRFIVHEPIAQTAATRPDNHWKSRIKHRRLFAVSVLALIVFVISQFVVGLMQPSATGPYQDVVGTVEACGIISAAGIRGANRVVASIRVPDGSLVSVGVESNTPVAKGTHVVLRHYASGAYRLKQPL